VLLSLKNYIEEEYKDKKGICETGMRSLIVMMKYIKVYPLTNPLKYSSQSNYFGFLQAIVKMFRGRNNESILCLKNKRKYYIAV
jgi:hypothetical protein